jgi:hypothetical protein
VKLFRVLTAALLLLTLMGSTLKFVAADTVDGDVTIRPK